jgi:hypothetical protein
MAIARAEARSRPGLNLPANCGRRHMNQIQE